MKLRQNGQDVCEIEITETQPQRREIRVHSLIGGSAYSVHQGPPPAIAFRATARVNFGEAEIVKDDGTTHRILVLRTNESHRAGQSPLFEGAAILLDPNDMVVTS
jgi:hypothetical protein